MIAMEDQVPARRASGFISSSLEQQTRSIQTTMDRVIKRQRGEPTGADLPCTVGVQTQLKPSQVKTTSNIFGDLASDDEEEEDAGLDEDASDEQELEDVEVDEDASDDEPQAEDGDAESESEADDPAAEARRREKQESESAAFSLALDKILNRDLPSTARKDPVLARSVASRQVKAEKLDAKLERKVRQQMTAEKKAKLDKGHDDLARFRIGAGGRAGSGVTLRDDDGDDSDADTTVADRARVLDRERQMRKVAQRGCVRLFNAIRAAQTQVQQEVDEGALRRKARRDEVIAAREEAAAAAAAADSTTTLVKDEAKPNLLDMIMAGGV